MARKRSKAALFVRDLVARTGLSTRQLGYAVRPEQLRTGNDIRILRGAAEVYAAMLQAIAEAEYSVCLETYILACDRTGERFAAALGERARRGVAVRLIYDAVGSRGMRSEYLEALERDGVEIIEYHPLEPWKKHFGVFRRDHRKVLVVDDRVAFAGGFNITDAHLPVEEGGEGWYDIHCRVRGPIVHDLARLFRRVWVREGGRPYPVARPQGSAVGERAGRTSYSNLVQPECGSSLARVVDNRKVRQRWKIHRAYLHAIKRARDSIHIMNAYFLPDRGIRRALRRARNRGVEVRVIVPERSDILVVGYAGRHMYRSLLEHGIEIVMWPDTMMHAKAAIIDSVWASVGSYNLDSLSLTRNLEVMIEVIDPALASEADRRFIQDAEACIPLTVESLEQRPMVDKMLSWFFYQFRRWM